MMVNVILLLLAFMIILQKYQSDKRINQLESQLHIQSKINSELIKSTTELLTIDRIIVNNMVKPLVNEVSNLTTKIENVQSQS